MLSGEAKAKLAGELTAFHLDYDIVPKKCVHVVFYDYSSGRGFTMGEVAATAAR